MKKILNEKELNERLKDCYPKLAEEYKGSGVKTKFKCHFCDKIFITLPNKVFSKHTKSCGCVSIGKRKGTKNISSTFYSRLLQHAKIRNLEIDIDINYLEKLILKQNFKCSLSGVEISAGYKDLNLQTASVDRIDNDKGYIKNNVQFVHKDVNWMKQDFNQEYFINLCKKISKENK